MYDSITKRVKHLENATGPGRFVFCMITPLYGTCGTDNIYADPDAAAAACKETERKNTYEQRKPNS